jgi:hypothetical protein
MLKSGGIEAAPQRSEGIAYEPEPTLKNVFLPTAKKKK